MLSNAGRPDAPLRQLQQQASHILVERTSPKTQLAGGLVSLALGLFAGGMIYLHPEGLRAPAWVALVAASAFVFAGLSLIASALRVRQIGNWLVVLAALSLFAPGAWVAFGPGARECSISSPMVQGVATDVLCRGAFGIGAIIMAAVVVLLIRRINSKGYRNED